MNDLEEGGEDDEREVASSSSPDGTRKPSRHLLAGVSAGLISTLIFHPLDLVKIRFQVSRDAKRKHKLAAVAAQKIAKVSVVPSLSSSSSSSSKALTATASRVGAAAAPTLGNVPQYTSVYGAFTRIIADEGVGALYNGLTPAMTGATAAWGLYFFFYERSKQRKMRQGHLHGNRERLGPAQHMASGLEAGVITSLLTNPIWLIKTRLQLQIERKWRGEGGVSGANKESEKCGRPHANGQGGGSGAGERRPYTGMVDAFRRILMEEGVPGLYRGIVPALLLT